MGLFNRLKGVKDPAEGVAPVPPEELKQSLLGLNSDAVPFSVTAGLGGKEGDLVAEWRIVDAKWVEIFARAKLKKTHKIYVTLDPKAGEARVLEESWDLEWAAGVPNMRLSAEAFRGRTLTSKSFGKGFAFKGVNPLDYGQVYHYSFDVSDMKGPIADVVTGAGWTLRPVLTKRKLAG